MTKTRGFLLPESIGANTTRDICITIPDTPEYNQAFWGHIWYLGRWFAWQHGEPGDDRAKLAAEEWRAALSPAYDEYLAGGGCAVSLEDVRQNTETPCILEKTADGETWEEFADLSLCATNKIIRYNPSTEHFETSIDGGENWTEDDTVDPRITPAVLLPPNGNRCDAAASMVRFIRDFITQLANVIGDGVNVLTLVSVVVTIAALLVPGINIVAFIFLDVWLLLISIGESAIVEAFTETVYDDLLCIFYCRIQADGSVTADDFSDIVTEILAHYSGDVRTILSGIVQFIGINGLQNAGGQHLDTDDCSDCDCPVPFCEGDNTISYEFDSGTGLTWAYAALDSLFNISFLDESFGEPAPSVRSNPALNGGEARAGCCVFVNHPNIDAGGHWTSVVKVKYRMYVSGGSGQIFNRGIYLYSGDTNITGWAETPTDVPLNQWVTVEHQFDYSGSADKVRVQFGVNGGNPAQNQTCWIDNVCVTAE